MSVLTLAAMNLVTELAPAVTSTAFAAVIAFVLSMLLTPFYTALAFRFKAWKKVRDTALTGEKATVFHKLHKAKHARNIPTMAGLVMVLVITIVTLTINLSRDQTYLPLFGTLAAGLIGLIDDLINIRTSYAGLHHRIKFLLISAIALAVSFYSFYKLGYSSIALPFDGQLPLGIFIIPLFAFVIVATANAVNMSDGLDGLAGGLLSIAFGTYAIIALLQGNFGIATFCATVVGTLLAYTWFNIFPARFFMGDVGSFALGTALAIVALLTDTILLLPIIGGMFVIEAGSSLAQITSKRLFKRKILRSAPIHHHFEALGWPETKVTMRFWVLGSVFGVFGIVIAVVSGVI